MFTGIVTDVGRIEAIAGRADLKRISVATRYDTKTIDLGASIMVNGICLTAVEFAPGRFDAELGAETLAVTTAASWREGQAVNLERSLRAGDELGGHIVSGHVDGVATVVRRDDLDGMARIDLRAPGALARFIAAKGSIALDGISLTVNRAEGAEFSVLLIPHTLAATSWRDLAAGDRVNLEVDMLARYVARLAEFPQAR
jgi:riboflavin synthase